MAHDKAHQHLLARTRDRATLPPGPRTPATVNLLRLSRRPFETLLGWHARYGDLFTVRYPIFGTGVYVADPDAIRALHTGDQSDLRAGEANAPLSAVLGEHSVLVLDGARHLRERRLLLPPFQGSAVQAFRTVIREVAEREVGNWRPGERLVMRDRMRALTFEVIARAVFGVAEQERIERLRRALTAVIDEQMMFLLPAALRRDLGPLTPWARFQRRLRAADALLHEEIARRRAAADLDERTDVLSLLLRARDEDGRPMSDVELRDELMTMLLAGHETTANSLAFAFDLLPRHPHVIARLRDEETGGDGERAYLDAVVQETLRLRPIIDANQRRLTRPRVVAGWELPAGVAVYPAIAVVHHRADLYPEPEAFRPERFLDGRTESYAWLPFGGGIRRCIGAALAQAEIAEVIRVAVARAEWRPLRAESEPVVMRGITLVPRYGAPVEIVRTDKIAAPL